MIIPVRCFSCNNEIGDKYELYRDLLSDKENFLESKGLNGKFKELLDKINAAPGPTDYLYYKKTQIEELNKKYNMLNDGFTLNNPIEKSKPDLEEFLNMLIFILLDFNNYCCNRHFISHIELINEIN